MINKLIFLFLFASISMKAQPCEGFFPMNKGSIMETTTFNEKGKSQTVSTITIQDIVSTGNGVKLSIHADIVDEKGKSVSSADYDAKCSNGSFSIDMKSMLSPEQLKSSKDMTVTIEADDIVYPLDFTVGEMLKDAHLKMNVSMNNMNMPGTTIDITNRKIEGKETITTPAGSFECLKISSNIKIKNIIGYEMKSIEWISKGNGVIRTESYRGDKMKGYSLLTKLSK